MPDIAYHDYPPITGLPKLPKPSDAPLRLQVSLSAKGGAKPRAARINASPFHGVTRFALVKGDGPSETFHNGAGDASKVGRYQEREQIDPAQAHALQPGALPRVCWKVRNTSGFKRVRFELFGKGKDAPALWSVAWSSREELARLQQNPLTAGSKTSGGRQVPIDWTGSIAWASLVTIPLEQLSPEQGPYQLRMTVNDGTATEDPLGYPLVAWTYLYPAEGAVDPPADDSLGGTDDEPLALSLIVEAKKGVAYTLDDGVLPASEGKVDAEGVLIHPVSPRATGCTLTFKDGSEPIMLTFAPLDEDAGWAGAELLEGEEDEEEPGFLDGWEDEDEPVLSLIVADMAGKGYTLDDGSGPQPGTVDADGLLVHPITPGATGCTITFEGLERAVVVEFV